jgi:hypothetical protein
MKKTNAMTAVTAIALTLALLHHQLKEKDSHKTVSKSGSIRKLPFDQLMDFGLVPGITMWVTTNN